MKLIQANKSMKTLIANAFIRNLTCEQNLLVPDLSLCVSSNAV